MYVLFVFCLVALKDTFVARRKERAVIEKVGDILVDCVCRYFRDAVFLLFVLAFVWCVSNCN